MAGHDLRIHRMHFTYYYSGSFSQSAGLVCTTVKRTLQSEMNPNPLIIAIRAIQK